MRKTLLAAAIATLLLGAAAPRPTPPLTPQESWKASIAEQNEDYARAPHAMLKIQDSAYLGEGQSATLEGRKGRPGSWHWTSDSKAPGKVRAVLRIWVQGGKLTALRNGKPVPGITKSIAIDRHVDVAGYPTQVGAGIPGWRVFVYNQRNPAARNFTGVSYFPYDPAWRVTANFNPDPTLPPHVFRTSRGTDKQFFHAGDAYFRLRGQPVILPFYADSRDPAQIKDISAFFTDELTGKGAYGTGRYVDASSFGKFPPARIVIDFNQAYNPNCARSAHFTCPVAEDHVALAVRVGERDPHAPY